jgi:hypothetical protein
MPARVAHENTQEKTRNQMLGIGISREILADMHPWLPISSLDICRHGETYGFHWTSVWDPRIDAVAH